MRFSSMFVKLMGLLYFTFNDMIHYAQTTGSNSPTLVMLGSELATIMFPLKSSIVAARHNLFL